MFPVFVPIISSTGLIFGVSTSIFVIEVSVDEIIFLVLFVPFIVSSIFTTALVPSASTTSTFLIFSTLLAVFKNSTAGIIPIILVGKSSSSSVITSCPSIASVTPFTTPKGETSRARLKVFFRNF